MDELLAEIDALRAALARAGGPLAGLVGRSASMQRVFGEVLRLATLDGAVAVRGESGTGRSTVAAALHRLSDRRRRPLETYRAPVGWGSPESQALSDAVRRAGAGTLVVDRLSHAPEECRSALARAAAQVGGPRWIFATGPSPEAVPAGLEVAAIELLPLRQRKEDIPLLADHFLHEIESGARAGVRRIETEALEAMRAHEWPGNVRELRNVVERAHRLTSGPAIGPKAIQSVLGRSSALPEDGAPEVPGESGIVLVRVGDSMAEVERRMLQRTLQFARGNKRKAAELLELSLKTIYNKVKEYGLEREFNRRFRKAPRSD
jgi:DNA-binding NtrC family response regulator